MAWHLVQNYSPIEYLCNTLSEGFINLFVTMQTLNTRFFNILISLLALALIAACSAERKIAKAFVDRNEQPSVLLFFPEEILKSNLKTEEALASDSMPFWDQDSIIRTNDLFLGQIDDSLFLAKCKLSSLFIVMSIFLMRPILRSNLLFCSARCLLRLISSLVR